MPQPKRRLIHPEFRRFVEDNDREILRLRRCTVFRVGSAKKDFRLGITFKTRAGSTERSRVKRQVRETFKDVGPSLDGYDYNVVVSRREAFSHPGNRQLRDELVASLGGAGWQRVADLPTRPRNLGREKSSRSV